MDANEPLRIVVYKEDEKFIAQCVDFDICTQADDVESLKARMDCLIEMEMGYASESGQPVDPAPERFHNMWDQNLASNSSNEYKVVAA